MSIHFFVSYLFPPPPPPLFFFFFVFHGCILCRIRPEQSLPKDFITNCVPYKV